MLLLLLLLLLLFYSNYILLKISLFEIKGKLTDNNNKYRVTAILKVETDIIANISASLVGQAGIFVIMSVEAFRTDVIAFIGCVIMCFYVRLTEDVIICMIGMYDQLYFLLLYIWFGIEIYGI
jgi:preprotein translocase subunit SecB